MDKRKFLTTGSASALSLACLAQTSAASAPGRGPTLLTVTGAIRKVNRGPFDSALDQLMHKQQITFDKAHAFDFSALTALPAISIRPTLEYDAKVHVLRGPLLTDVLQAAGAVLKDPTQITLRALDGYSPVVGIAQLRSMRYMVATHLDGHPIPLGGLGPLWAMVDADRIPALAALPVNQRFALCPWGLYHIVVPS
jgi:hypothetical protein